MVLGTQKHKNQSSEAGSAKSNCVNSHTTDNMNNFYSIYVPCF